MGYFGTGGKAAKTYKPTPLNAGGSLNIESSGEGTPSGEAGKGSIDLTDVAGSIGQTLGSFGGFLGDVGGGVAGALGSIGPDGETASIGQLAEDVGRIPGGIGDAQLPYLGNDPSKEGATLGEVPGVLGDVISAPGRFVEGEAAKNRARGGPRFDPLALLPGGGVISAVNDATNPDRFSLPPDLQARLDEGESVDVIADELLERGQGYSQDGVTNLVGQVLLDPLNLIAPGASKLAKGVQGAGMAVRGKELTQLGLSEKAVGTIYNAASRGLSGAGAATMDRVIGPVTSGVFHTLGTKPYQSLVRGAQRLDRSYGQQFERNFSLGAGQLPRAVIAREIANDVASGLAKKVKDAEGVVQTRLFAKKAVASDELERRTEELLGRVTPSFSVIDDDIADATVRKYAEASGMSVEDAARTLGKVDRDTARTVHLAYYGKAGGDLAELKAVIPSSKSLDVERLTVIAPDTLTDELADAVLAGDISGAEAVENFSVLANHFGGKSVADSDVMAFVQKLRDEDALPQIVRLPKTGKNALPKELGDWRAKNKDFGYDLGFSPKDGWKSVVDDEGNVLMSDPFVHFVSDVDPVTMRNPLGRLMDGLMRGTTQTVIVQESRQRMVDIIARAKLPISDNQARAIHRAIVNEAADRKLTPRALVGEHTAGGRVYDEIFKKHLDHDTYEALIAKYDPAFIVMKAFEGNWKTIGLTQKLTGKAKSTVQVGKYHGPGGLIAQITERAYPLLRFTARPTFQMQEVIESPVFNALRGVTDRKVSDDLLDVYRGLAEQPEFKYLTEANYLSIIGNRVVGEEVGKKIGPAMGRFANIQARKNVARVRQTMFEHGEQFRDAVQTINPKYWAAMEEAYGTSDPRVIADRFMGERMALGANENIDEAMALIDEVTAPPEVIDEMGTPKGFSADPAAFAEDIIDPSLPATERGMWHATTNMEAVRTGGLKSRTELGRTTTGLGGGMVDLGRFVSVTVDEGHATTIADRLRLASRAARKEISVDEIADSFREYDDTPEYFARVAGVPMSGDWDEVLDAVRAKYQDDQYTLVQRLDEGLGEMFADEQGFTGRVGLTGTTEQMAALKPEQIGVVRVAARDLGDAYKNKGVVRNVGPDVSELQFESADLVVLPDDAGARIQAAYDAGDIASGQAQNIAEGVRRGGSAASGGALKDEGALPGKAGDAVLQAFKDSFREASNTAFQTHFYNPQRGWLERSLNHPYLGLYPLSYMWGKVLPEFARFLVKRPFGVNAPLVGAANLERVQQAYLGALAEDPEFSKYIEENEDAIYFANLLFPGNPVNMAVNAPAWARHVSEDAAAGRKVTGATVTRELTDTTSYALGPLHDAASVNRAGSDLVSMGEDIFANLTKAAEQYDGQFPLRSSEPVGPTLAP